jgi:hypothetical protein
MSRRVVLGVVCCAVAAAALACTAPSVPPARHDPTPAPRVKDRDEHALVDALRRLDMCALLGTVVPETTVAATLGPSSCQSPGLDVEVTVLRTDERLGFPSRIVNGAKVYLWEGAAGCTTWLPVSFRLAIQFRGAQTCDELAGHLAPAVAALTDPAAVEATPRWETCAALRTVAGTDADRVDNLDSCADKKSFVVLALKYSVPAVSPPSGWRTEDVDGVEVSTNDDRDPESPSCTAEWVVGPAVTSHADNDLMAQVRGVDCGRVTPLVAPLVAALRTPPGAGSPRRPLLYGPGESDSPYPGACSYVDTPSACVPYTRTPLPPAGELLSTKDPDVSCTVAADAVTTGFGAEMKPVITSDTCSFVSPERLVQVTFEIWQEALAAEANSRGERVTIAGHPGFVTRSTDRRNPHEVLLAATTSPDQPGTLRLTVQAGPVATELLPPAVIDKVEPTLAAIVGRYFS